MAFMLLECLCLFCLCWSADRIVLTFVVLLCWSILNLLLLEVCVLFCLPYFGLKCTWYWLSGGHGVVIVLSHLALWVVIPGPLLLAVLPGYSQQLVTPTGPPVQ